MSNLEPARLLLDNKMKEDVIGTANKLNFSSRHQPAPRTPLNLVVDFRRHYSRVSNHGEIRNLSVTGAFIRHSAEMGPGTRIQLEFTVDGEKRKIPAKVIWSNSTGCGVKFDLEKKQDHRLVEDIFDLAQSVRDESKSLLHGIFKVI